MISIWLELGFNRVLNDSILFVMPSPPHGRGDVIRQDKAERKCVLAGCGLFVLELENGHFELQELVFAFALDGLMAWTMIARLSMYVDGV